MPKRASDQLTAGHAPSSIKPKKGEKFWFSDETDTDVGLENRTDSETSTFRSEGISSCDGKTLSKETAVGEVREIDAV